MKNRYIENPNDEDMLTCLMKGEEFISQINTKMLIFSINSKSSKLIIFVLERGSENDWIR